MAIKAVIIGFSHMHINEIALYINDAEGMELCAAADVPSQTETTAPKRYTPAWNLQNLRENYCSNIYDDYRKMLDEVKPDIAFILTENGQKPEVVSECAKRGVNVSIEKPIAVSLEEAKKIKASVDKYKIEAVVNWPVAWRDYLYKMKNALDSGIVGSPVKLRYINGHTGPLGKGAKHRGVSANAEEMTDDERGKTWWHKAELGEEFKNMPCHYVHQIRTGEPIFDMLTLDKNIEIMAIIDAAVKSSKSGKEEKICD